MNKLGDLIKNRRKLLGLSLRDAAVEMDISHSYLNILEKGEDPNTKVQTSPTILTFMKLSVFLGISLPDLLVIAGYIDNCNELTPNYDDENFKIFYDLAKDMNITELLAAKDMIKRGISIAEINKALKVFPKDNT